MRPSNIGFGISRFKPMVNYVTSEDRNYQNSNYSSENQEPWERYDKKKLKTKKIDKIKEIDKKTQIRPR